MSEPKTKLGDRFFSLGDGWQTKAGDVGEVCELSPGGDSSFRIRWKDNHRPAGLELIYLEYQIGQLIRRAPAHDWEDLLELT